MTNKERIRKQRDGAITAQLSIDEGDKIVEMLSRSDGLYMVTLEKIIRVNLPDNIDPEMEYEDAPITQMLIVSNGSRSPIVARTILQTKEFLNLLPKKDQQTKIQDVAWEVMLSLLAFDKIVVALRISIDTKKAEISENYEKYVTGPCPPFMPIVENLEIDFRSAVLIANHTLNAVSELFSAFFDRDFKRGRFDKLGRWTKQQFGEGDPLARMLDNDNRWIKMWGEVRNAFEHPKPDYYVRVNNFRLLANRQIQLPTWQLKHPELDLHRPQVLVEALEVCRENILGFFENLLVELTGKTIKSRIPIGILDKEPKDRDPDCPTRYAIRAFAS